MLQDQAFKFKCSCGKLFKSEKRFNSHNAMCSLKMFSQNKREREDEEAEISEIPSQLEMYKLIIAQQREIDSLKKMVQNMEKHGTSTAKKKTDIISYLNMKYKPEQDIIDWLKKFDYNNDHYEILCNSSYLDSVIAAFQDNMTVKGGCILPIQGFTQKAGILFKYENKSWSAVTISDFKKIMEIIFPIILRRHKVWEKSAITDITNERQQDQMLDRLNRIFCLESYSVNNRDSKLKTAIYNFIKKKLQIESNITLSYDV